MSPLTEPGDGVCDQVYQDYRLTFYCGCDYSADQEAVVIALFVVLWWGLDYGVQID